MAGLNFDTISLPTLIAFATTTFLLNIPPGPAVMQVIGHSVSNGWKRAQASILGICAGNAVYCLLAVFGLGALILAVPRAFEIVRWCGVLYLCWLGGKSILSAFKGSRAQEAPTLQASSSVLFRQSLLVQAANPKSYLYFCALLPTFAGEAEGAPLRMAILGIVSMIMEYPVLLGYSVLGSQARRLLTGSAGRRALDGLAGTALVAAAASVASTSLKPR